MTRGLLSGLFWGGTLCLGAAVALSTLVPLPAPPQVQGADPANVALAVQEPDDSGAPAASQDAAPASEAASVLSQPESETAPQRANTGPAAVPQTGTAEHLEAPDPDAPDAQMAAIAEQPVLPTPQALAPMSPPQTDDVVVSTEPAPRPVPQAVASAPEVTGDAPQVALAPDAATDPALTPNAALPEEDAPQTEQPQATLQPEQPASPQVDETLAEAPSEETIDPSRIIDIPVEELPVAEAPVNPTVPTTPILDETPTPTPTETQEAPQIAELAPEGAVRPRIGKPATTLTDRSNGVRINRAVPAAQGDESVETPQATDTTDDADAPALRRFARDFDNPGDKPLMSIVLIDDGADLKAAEGGLAALRQFPYPVSFAINASLPDANARMDAYRAEGFEVLAMVDLPAGAQPTDAEVTLAVALEKLPETVAVLDGLQGGLQPNRETADQVTAILGQTGHGLVAQAQGLNTMPKLANKAGVPAAPVFRDFDGKGQTAQVIRRFLDQAAFKADQEGGVIMLGRIRPETIQALLVWGLADRAGKVALVPVSAVLVAQ